MALQAAIEHYHALLTDELAAETQAQLDDQLQRRGLFFGERPLCTVLRPRFFTPNQYSFLKARCCLLLRAFDTAYQAAMADDSFRRQFRLFDWEEELIRHEPGFHDPSPVSRLDAFFVAERGGLRFTEYNAETPAAASYNDLLAAVFFGLPVMREFLRRYEVRAQPSRHNVLHALISAYHQWSGRRDRPRIAIIDWREVPTYSEFVISADYFRSQGIETTIADPREVEYRNGKLYAGDLAVDLIYKRVLISELVERGGLDHPIVRAVADGAVCMVNSFRCKILHKKASLAVLSDERNAHLFDASEIEAVEAHIPWTRVVEERRTIFHGREIDLVPFMHEHRDQLVLKPNDEYGGAGIVLGWESDDSAWASAVEQALREAFVVQERIQLPREAYPSMVEGKLQFYERIIDTAPFAFYGDYMDGCLTRLSTESLVNVTTGGGSSLATFIVEAR
jgi:glutathionylspermidine synthase